MSGPVPAAAAGDPPPGASLPVGRRGRREDIVAAAARFFATAGYHDVGMRDIAEAVGMRGASLYNHFSSKEEILYAICIRMTRDPVEQQLPLLDLQGSPVTRLAALVRAHLRHLSENRVEHLVSLREMTALTPEHRSEIDDQRRYYQRRVRDVIAAGARAGEFRVDDPRTTAVAVLDMMNGVSWWLRDHHDVDELTEAYVHLVLRLLGHDEAGDR